MMEGPPNRWHERFDAALQGCDYLIEIGHLGSHFGIVDAMETPYSTEEQIRSRFLSLTLAEQDECLKDFELCPW